MRVCSVKGVVLFCKKGMFSHLEVFYLFTTSLPLPAPSTFLLTSASVQT